jgi:CRISPR-associated protein Cas1
MSRQPDLPPDSRIEPRADDGPSDHLPVRMLSEYAYCPRLFHLMHVEGRWADNLYTIEGRHAHRRVDDSADGLPEPGSADADEAPTIARSVHLGSDRLGLVARLDLVQVSGPEAVPVDTKRGRVPDNPERSWEPERVQLMAQGLLLREHGFATNRGVLYFAGSRARVEIPFTPELESRTLHLIEQARLVAQSRQLPPPLDDSPKCNGCSLSGICLPDETLSLQEVPPDPAAPTVRRLYPARDEALPLYVQEQGARVGKQSESLVVSRKDEELARAPLKDVGQLVLCGNVSVSAQTIHLLCEAGIPIVHLSRGHWFYGITHGIHLRNAYNRVAQFAAAADPERSLRLAKAIVAAKGANQRTLLRRNASPRPGRALDEIRRLLEGIDAAPDRNVLLGIEGALAAGYFREFASMLGSGSVETEWEFANRNRRPPLDPINALLSFGYALLAKECTVALLSEGLDPWWGLFHQPRHGRPALALDLMEEFRPLVVDSVVVTAVNTRMVTQEDFVRSPAGCMLKPAGKKSFIRAYESRLDQLVTHPVFGYRCSWRAVIRVQARRLARWLRGDVPEYVAITTR